MPDPHPLSQRARWAGGQPISDLMHRALAHPNLISLAAGFVDQASLPSDEVRAAFDDVWRHSDASHAALQYGTTQGHTRLREMLLAQLFEADGQSGTRDRPAVEQVVLTAGSNQFLHLVCEALLDPGDIVLTTAPSYFVFLGMLRNLGARSIGVMADADGMVPEALEEQLRHIASAGELDRVKAIYVVSYFDNPRGVTLALDRRAQVIEIARRWSHRVRIHVIDDAAYRDLRYQGADLPSLISFDDAGDTVILAQTFSKSFSPGIRVGYGILPRQLVKPICELKGNIDFGSPNFNQHLLASVVESGAWRIHVDQLRTHYSAKLDAMLSACDEFLAAIPGDQWLRPLGGLYIWLQLPESMDAGPQGRLLAHALDEGVLYVPGGYCFPMAGEPASANTIRLSFGVQPAARLRRGIELLSRAIQKTLAGE